MEALKLAGKLELKLKNETSELHDSNGWFKIILGCFSAKIVAVRDLFLYESETASLVCFHAGFGSVSKLNCFMEDSSRFHGCCSYDRRRRRSSGDGAL